MAKHEFDITIGADGNVELHIKGCKGSGCLDIVKMFEEIVGEVKSQNKTEEFYEPQEHVQHRIDQRS